MPPIQSSAYSARRTISLKYEIDTETNTRKRSYESSFQINGGLFVWSQERQALFVRSGLQV